MSDAGAMYLESDLEAERISSALSEHGLLLPGDAVRMKRFLRGW